MTPNAISERSNREKAEAFQLTPGGDVANAARMLGGTYRVKTEGGSVEIEIVNGQTLRRSVIYVHPDRELIIFLPSATYAFHIRNLSGGENSTVRIGRMSIRQRIGFYAIRAARLLKLGPKESFAVVQRFLHRSRSGVPVAARTNTAVEVPTAVLPNRAVFTPAPDAIVRQNVSIIIPTKERVDLLRACIQSLTLIKNAVFEIIIVDNGATGKEMTTYLSDLANREDVRVLRRDIPFNFSQLCNDGARLARNPLLLFLNDDIEALDGAWLQHMRDFAARSDVGVVGARLLFPSGALQHGGIASNLVPGPGHPWRGTSRSVWETHPLLAEAGEVDAVTGACLMIPRDLFGTLGGFNETDFAITLNDVDLCIRVREQGFKIVYVPQATLLHKESQTRQADDKPEETIRHTRELATFYRRYPIAAQSSVFYPAGLRRDSDNALPV